MAQAGVNIQIRIKDIYDALCPECQTKVRALIKERITDLTVQQIIGA